MDTRSMTKDWHIELGKYDKIAQVFVSYREFGIQGIAFTIIDAIGREKNASFGVKYYNHAMTLKPNEYITQLSGKIKKTEEQTIISSLRVHTNMRPNNRLSSNEDKSNSNKETKEIEFSKSILTRDGGIIVKISATRNEDKKKGGGDNGPFILASIGIDVEEEVDSSVLVWHNYSENFIQKSMSEWKKWLDVENKTLGSYDFPTLSKERDNWYMKLDRCEYIKEIIISHDETTVFGVGFVKVDAEGRITPTQWFGGQGPDNYRIVLKFNEYIVQISGTYGDEMIKSLRVYTNLWPGGYQLCGKPDRDDSTRAFSSPVQTSDCIAGYYGTHTSRNLISIGIVVIETEIRRKEVSIPEKASILETEKKGNTHSEGGSIEETKKSNVKSEEVSIPERGKRRNVKNENVSEEVSTPETDKESNVQSEEVSIPKTEKKSNAKSEEVLSNPEAEKKRNTKKEEASTPETDKKSNVKSEEVVNPEMEKKSNTKSDEALTSEVEKKSNAESEEALTSEMEKNSNIKSEEPPIPKMEKKSDATREIVKEK